MDKERSGQNEVESVREDKGRDAKNKAWTVEEEKELLVALKSAKTAGLRSENGFKPGCHMFVLNHIRSRFPNTAIQINPHIMSKLKVWKHDHGFLTSLLAKSGVGWDDEKKMVKCDVEIWQEHAKAYKGMRNKKDVPWPYYDDWCLIFGKDRATGTMKKDLNDVATKLFGEDVMRAKATSLPQLDAELRKGKSTSLPHTEAEPEEVVGDGPCSETVQGADFSTSNPLKRPCPKATDSMTNIFAGAVRDMVAIARDNFDENKKTKVQSPDETKELRARLYEALERCPNLTLSQILHVGRKLCKDTETLDFFFTLPEHAREPFAIQELEAMGIPFDDAFGSRSPK